MAVPPPLLPSDAKTVLRRALRARREAFATADASAALCDRLMARLDGAGLTAGYVAHRGEPDIGPLLIALNRAGGATALPRIEADRTMRFVAWQAGAPLDRGPLGIAQPFPGDAVVPTTLLVPLLGFDRSGARLGQGGGYYDRWCAAHPDARRIGIAWSVQEVDALPADPWDQRLDAIVTETDWIVP